MCVCVCVRERDAQAYIILSYPLAPRDSMTETRCEVGAPVMSRGSKICRIHCNAHRFVKIILSIIG